MPRSRKFRKSQNQVKPEWGKNNPQTKAKNKKLMIYGGIIAIAVIVGASLLVMGQNGLFASPSSSPSPNPSSSPTPAPSASPIPSATPLTSPVGEYSANGTRILLQTSMGDIIVQLRDDKPITTANFISLASRGLYDGTLFHRVISGFMIQGGIVYQNLSPITDEIGNDNHNSIGTIAMANAGPNTATSSFFINVNDNNNSPGFSDSSYAVFGKVIYGMDTVMKISNVPVTANPQMQNENSKPVQDITLIKATVLP
jgi:cyclophilin family peptidyl-prolyl cis-trans isomerase